MHLFGGNKATKGEKKLLAREMCKKTATTVTIDAPRVCSELLLISACDLANGTLIILVIHRLVCIFAPHPLSTRSSATTDHSPSHY